MNVFSDKFRVVHEGDQMNPKPFVYSRCVNHIQMVLFSQSHNLPKTPISLKNVNLGNVNLFPMIVMFMCNYFFF